MERTILHVDMDAFYAAVEQRDHPGYRGRPVIVGADPRGGRGRGIVATCSYEARKFGIHSAQPISEAWKLCPRGIYLPPDMRKYARVSRLVMGILSDFTDLVEPVSIDEAFLDVTGCRRLFGAGDVIARKIRERVARELGLTASVGVAANKFVAKVASDLEKPDGLVVVEPGREREFLAPLAVGRLWGVGPRTEARLKALGIGTVGQLAALAPMDAARLLGDHGEHLWRLARGIDDRPVSAGPGCRSIGHEVTFEQDTADPGRLRNTLLDLSGRVARRLRAEGALARTVTLKFRQADFTTSTRRRSLAEPVDTAEAIFPVAFELMQGVFRAGMKVRLLGVTVSGLEPGSLQPTLFPPSPSRDRKLAEAEDDIARRFGARAITRASLVGGKEGA
ncbi:MAG: DNA polymerase IV [Acidobacteria bacterium]|nr:DNA polymerase IV [Acidobacteriota bacterium]